MAATTASTSLVPVQPAFTESERLALAGFLAGYRGLTREAYTLDLRQFTGWCRARSLPLFSVRRADIETFAGNWKPGAGPAPRSRGGCAPSPGSTSTPSRKNSSTTRPRRTSAVPGWTTSRTPPRWTATNSARLLVAAGLGPPAEHALISLLALNGLRVSEATGADIEHLGLERGHRTLVITRKGGKVVTIPLAPRTARAIDLAIGERTEGPLFVTADGQAAGPGTAPPGSSAGSPGAPGSPSTSARTHCGTRFITAALDAGVPLRDVQEAASHADPRTTMRYDRARTSLDRHATYIVATYIAGAAR